MCNAILNGTTAIHRRMHAACDIAKDYANANLHNSWPAEDVLYWPADYSCLRNFPGSNDHLMLLHMPDGDSYNPH